MHFTYSFERMYIYIIVLFADERKVGKLSYSMEMILHYAASPLSRVHPHAVIPAILARKVNQNVQSRLEQFKPLTSSPPITPLCASPSSPTPSHASISPPCKPQYNFYSTAITYSSCGIPQNIPHLEYDYKKMY